MSKASWRAFAATLLAAASVAAAAEAPLARIRAKDGGFVAVEPDGAAKPFYPRGFNYIRLRSARQQWHWTFNSSYAGPRAGAALADMAKHGFNVVRVFISPGAGSGIVDSWNATKLSDSYMDHVCDFLKRARQNNIHVLFALDGPPRSERYRKIADTPPPPFRGRNVEYLYKPAIEAKAQYMADFVSAIAARDKTLLSTVFAYELENESSFSARSAPFRDHEGTFTFEGKTYKLDDDAQLQALADAGIRATADACCEAVKKVDPQAMVSCDVFTFAAVGRTGPGHLLTDKTRDSRFPARPLALVNTKLDYIDIHLYSYDERGLQRDLRSIEWPELKQACKKADKPLLMGEFGAFKGTFKTAQAAAKAMAAHAKAVLDLGFAGWLYWTYDTDEQPHIWNAEMDDGAVFRALTAIRGYPQDKVAESAKAK